MRSRGLGHRRELRRDDGYSTACVRYGDFPRSAHLGLPAGRDSAVFAASRARPSGYGSWVS